MAILFKGQMSLYGQGCPFLYQFVCPPTDLPTDPSIHPSRNHELEKQHAYGKRIKVERDSFTLFWCCHKQEDWGKKQPPFYKQIGSRIQPVYGRQDEQSELRLQYYGLEKCDKQRLKPHQQRCVRLIFGRVAVKILLQPAIGLEVITLCCLITVPPTRWSTRVWLSP